jgi:hypothetical protein
MAANPFDVFDKPAANPFDVFDKPTAAAPASVAPRAAPAPAPTPAPTAAAPVDIGTQRDPNWKPSGNALLDFFTRPIAKTEDPLSAAKDYGLSAYDAATFGYGVPQWAQSSVAQAHQNLGPLLDPVAQGLGYAAGPGKIFLGPLARGAAGAAGLSGLGGSIAAGGLEGAGAGGLGAAGHGGDVTDIAKSAAEGGAGGALAGVTGGMGPKPKMPEIGAPRGSNFPATGMYAAKTAEYSPLDSIYFDQPTIQAAIKQGHDAIAYTRDPSGMGAPLDIPEDMNKKLGDFAQNPVVTGGNIQRMSRYLNDAPGQIGHRFADALDNVLNTAQPISGGQPGEAGAAQRLGDLWHGRIEDLKRLGEPGDLTQSQLAAAIKQTQQQKSNAPGTVPGQALADLAKANQTGLSSYVVRRLLAPSIYEGAAWADQSLDPEDTAKWIGPMLHGAAGAALVHAAPKLVAPRTAAPLNAARYAIATGQPMTTATGRVGDYLANLLYGHMAGQ